MNELITNTMQHASTGRDGGLIGVSFSCRDNHATLIVSDNGIGIPASVDMTISPGFRMQIVSILTAQLDGTLRFEGENGAKFVLEFEV
jgi:two-component sensor histidine kinase